MGRILQIQENKEMGPQVEAEVQQFASTALQQFAAASADRQVREAALDVLRALPARTDGEIRYLWQLINGTTENAIHQACAIALTYAEPKDTAARQELAQGQSSSIKEVREAVEAVMRRLK